MTQNYYTFYSLFLSTSYLNFAIGYLQIYILFSTVDRRSLMLTNVAVERVWGYLYSLNHGVGFGTSPLYLVSYSCGWLRFLANAMANLSDFVDEESQDVGRLLNSLRLPSNFTRHETLEDKDAIAELVEWKANAFNALKDIRGLLESRRHEICTSDLIYACAAFQGDGDWISEDMRALSSGKPVTCATTID